MSLQEEGQKGLKTAILCQQVFGGAVTWAQKESPFPTCLQLAVLELPTLLVVGVKKVKIEMCNGQQSEVSTALQDNNNNIH